MVLVISEKRKYFPLIQAHSCSPSHPYQNQIHNNVQKVLIKKENGWKHRNDTKQLLSKLEVSDNVA